MTNQKYQGNGKHGWEEVVEGRFADCCNGTEQWSSTLRLRVPGGWLYRVENALFDVDFPHHEHHHAESVVFVPMPEVVKHKV